MDQRLGEPHPPVQPIDLEQVCLEHSLDQGGYIGLVELAPTGFDALE